MNIISIILKIFTLMILFQAFVFVTIAQEKSENPILTNESVIELVKLGLSEGIIIAKIKSSKTDFDTLPVALVKLKEMGVSDNVVLTMIESKNKSDESKETSKSQSLKTADIKEVVGKRLVFIICDDSESRLETEKKLTKKGFSIVNNEKEADLLFEITYIESETKQKTGSIIRGSENKFASKIGKLTVKLNKNLEIFLVYSHEYPIAKAANMQAIFGVSYATPSLRDQVKGYLIDDFLNKLKKAGDKIK